MAFLGEKKVIGIIEDELLFGEFFSYCLPAMSVGRVCAHIRKRPKCYVMCACR